MDPVPSYTDAGVRTDLIIGRIEQVYECGGQNNTAAKVSCNKVSPVGNLQRINAFCDDGK